MADLLTSAQVLAAAEKVVEKAEQDYGAGFRYGDRYPIEGNAVCAYVATPEHGDTEECACLVGRIFEREGPLGEHGVDQEALGIWFSIGGVIQQRCRQPGMPDMTVGAMHTLERLQDLQDTNTTWRDALNAVKQDADWFAQWDNEEFKFKASA